MMSRVGVLGIVSHGAFLVLFSVVGMPILVAVNVGSIACFCVVLWATRRRNSTVAVVLTVTELTCHAFAATWLLGWDSAFQYYLLLIIPVVLQAEVTRGRKALGAVIGVSAFAGLTVWLGGAPPAAHVGQGLIVALRLMNSGMYLAMLCYLNFAYVSTVEGAETHLRRAADRDPMTGLLNRTSFLACAEHSLLSPRAEASWVIFVDIDHFKAINDRYGHAAGDEAIRRVSERIGRTVRHQDLVARWGGEEFLVLLTDADEATAVDVAERLRASVADPSAPQPFLRSITVTVGVARQDAGVTFDSTINRADEALYRGKEAGRDRVVVSHFPPSAPPPGGAAQGVGMPPVTESVEPVV